MAKRGIERVVFCFDALCVRHPLDHPADVLVRAAVVFDNLPGLPCNQRRIELALERRILKPEPCKQFVFVGEHCAFLGIEKSPIQQLLEAGESRLASIRTRARVFKVS